MRRRGRGDSTVEVLVVEPDDGGAPASPPTRRITHPWRWTTALVVVVALALAAVQWQRLGRDVDVADADVSWSSDGFLTCDGGAKAAVHIVTDESAEADTVDRLGEDPADIVTLTNRSARTVTLRLADATAGAFEPDVVSRSALDLDTPTAERVRTVDRVAVPAGASARLRLVSPRLKVHGDGAGLASVTSVLLKVTSLGVTTTHDVALATRIVGVSVGTANAATIDPGTDSPWSFVEDLCGPSAG